jgi:alkylation response protein AidB-like acyl-CoA dehydrogenase
MLNLAPTDDQELLRETTRRFLEETSGLTEVRRLADEPAGFDDSWWVRGAELGWLSLMIPDEFGGAASLGAGAVELAMLAEEMGRLISPGPFLTCNVVAAAVAGSGSKKQREALLPDLAAGNVVATWCPPAGGSRMGVQARATDGGFILTGVATPVEVGAQAQWLLVSCEGPTGASQFLIPASTAGIEIIALEGLDLVRRFAQCRFDDVGVDRDQMLGESGGAAADIEMQLQLALVLQCAETVGAAARVLEFTIEWAFDRYSFGRPLASYQALKHRYADMTLWSESSQAAIHAAAVAVADGAPEAAQLVRVAKSYVADRSLELIQDCVQLHGGMGVTWEHDIHLYLRRATVNRNVYGAPRDHRIELARLLVAAREAAT